MQADPVSGTSGCMWGVTHSPAGDLSLSSMVLHPLGEQSLCALLCSAPIRLIRFSSLLSITQKRHRVLKKQQQQKKHLKAFAVSQRAACCPPVFWRCSSVWDFLWRRVESKQHLMLSAEMGTHAGIPPLCAHHLNLPCSGRMRTRRRIFRSSSGPHDPVQHHTHIHTQRRTHSFASTQEPQRSSALHARTRLRVSCAPLWTQPSGPAVTDGRSVRTVFRSRVGQWV